MLFNSKHLISVKYRTSVGFRGLHREAVQDVGTALQFIGVLLFRCWRVASFFAKGLK